MKKFFLLSFIFFSFFYSSINLFAQNENIPQIENSEAEKEILGFKELWGYVMIGEESFLSADYPLTDVGYFVSAVNNFSDFAPVPKRADKFPNFKGRVHIVSSVDSKAQAHLLLDPKLPLRNKIIKQIVKEAQDYDGVQIDWEVVMKDDNRNFWNFLKMLKKRLHGKMLTVAIPARTRTLEKDAYDYAELSKIADKIIVMAYDEHWSTSEPGPIASLAWCKRIADYSKTVIPEEKLVMGCPFYARAWNDECVGRKAYRMYRVDNVIKDVQAKTFKISANGDLSFTYDTTTRVTMFYDTVESSLKRCRNYKENQIDRLAFWRVGQENPEFWENIEISN